MRGESNWNGREIQRLLNLNNQDMSEQMSGIHDENMIMIVLNNLCSKLS